MPEILKVLQLAQHNGVAQMDIGRGRVDSQLYAQRFARRNRFLKLRLQLILANDFGDTFVNIGKLFLNRLEGSGGQLIFLRTGRCLRTVRCHRTG